MKRKPVLLCAKSAWQSFISLAHNRAGFFMKKKLTDNPIAALHLLVWALEKSLERRNIHATKKEKKQVLLLGLKVLKKYEDKYGSFIAEPNEKSN